MMEEIFILFEEMSGAGVEYYSIGRKLGQAFTSERIK